MPESTNPAIQSFLDMQRQEEERFSRHHDLIMNPPTQFPGVFKNAHPAHEAIHMIDHDGKAHPENYTASITDHDIPNPAQLRYQANPMRTTDLMVKAHPALDAITQLDPELGIERPIGGCAKRDDGEGCDGCK